MRTMRCGAMFLALVVLGGCGDGARYVPVSGTITLDDRPLAKVMVTFQPEATTGADAGGVGSFGMTDEQGKFKLEVSSADPKNGALVGKHRVRIATPPPKGKEDSDAVGGGKKAYRDPIPAKYNTESTLTFDVPAGGTDKADFLLKR